MDPHAIVATADVGGEGIEFASRAVGEFCRQVRPTLVGTDVKPDLLRLVAVCGELGDERPDWYYVPPEVDDGSSVFDGWLMLGDDISFPMIGGVAVTCITRGNIGHKRRADRARFRAKRTAYREELRQQSTGDRGEYRRRRMRLMREIEEAQAPDRDEAA